MLEEGTATPPRHLQVQIERQGLPLEVSARKSSGSTRSTGHPPQAHRNSHPGHVQQDAAQRLDAGQPAADARAAIGGAHCITALGEGAGAILAGDRPDMVVSLVPHFNRALRESFDKAFPGRPFVTVLTDLADYPKHFWIEKPTAISGLRNRACRRAGPRARASGRNRFPDIRNDPAPALLRARTGGPDCRAEKTRPRSRSSHRHRSVRRIWHLEDAGHFAADQPVFVAGAAHHDLRAE